MVIDYKLVYPSGTATAHLINSFHTPLGAKLAKYAWLSHYSFFSGYIVSLQIRNSNPFSLLLVDSRKQVGTLGKFFSFSFLWSFFQWFFTAGDGCGFSSFPSFGLKAYENRYF